MADHKIKISGDFKQIQTGFQDLRKTLDGFSKKKHGINIDPKVFKTIDKEIKTTYSGLKDKTKELTEKINEMGLKLQKATSPKMAENLRRGLAKVGKELSQNVKETRGLEKSFGGILKTAEKSGIMGRIARGISGAFLPRTSGMGRMAMGAGGISGVMGGLGRAVSMIPVAGLAIGAGLGIYMGARALGRTRRELAGTNLEYMGLAGTTDANALEDIRTRGIPYGVGGRETMQQAIALRRATGDIGTFGDIQSFRLISGIQAQQSIGMLGGLRAGGIKGQAGMETLRALFEKAIANGFDRSRAGDYLEAISNYTGTMAQSGGVNIQALSSVTNALMGGNKFFTANAQRGLNAARGVESMFTGEGPGAVTAFMTLRQMYPNASPAELYWRRRMGFFQPGGMGERSREGFLKFIGTYGGMVLGRKPIQQGEKLTEDQIFNLMSGVGVALEAKGPQQPLVNELIKSFLNVAEKPPKEAIKDIDKAFKELEAGVLNSTDMTIKKNEAHFQELLFDVGNTLVPITASIEKGIWKVVDYLGAKMGGGAIPTAQERLELSEMRMGLRKIRKGRDIDETELKDIKEGLEIQKAISERIQDPIERQTFINKFLKEDLEPIQGILPKNIERLKPKLTSKQQALPEDLKKILIEKLSKEKEEVDLKMFLEQFAKILNEIVERKPVSKNQFYDEDKYGIRMR